MSFHEKSAWACLLSILLVFIPYFAIVFQQPMAFVGLFVAVVIALVILLTAFHIVNSIVTPSIRRTGDVPKHDELDRVIELRASKISGIVLGVFVICWLMNAMYGIPAIGVSQLSQSEPVDGAEAMLQFSIPAFYALQAVHTLFAGFVVANVVYYGSIIVGYRRLANG